MSIMQSHFIVKFYTKISLDSVLKFSTS